MKIDAVDESIIAAFQEDGRQSNREVARALNVSEGTVRQRLAKLLKAGVVEFDVVVDHRQVEIDFVAYLRISVAPNHLEPFLAACEKLPDIFYLAHVAGRFNVQALICTHTPADALRVINSKIEVLRGVHEIAIRQVVAARKHDFHEMVVVKR
jgi:Lrp/AsnC family transcriptional regulator, regulator for asnA, asnC and gidA